KGYIRRDPTKPRAIEVIDFSDNANIPKEEVVYAPVVGKVTAGVPITAIENVEEFIPLPKKFPTSEDQLFVLVIEGESMIESVILEGDMVVVKKQASADNGDIVVAMTMDGEATVKRFFKEKDYIR